MGWLRAFVFNFVENDFAFSVPISASISLFVPSTCYYRRFCIRPCGKYRWCFPNRHGFWLPQWLRVSRCRHPRAALYRHNTSWWWEGYRIQCSSWRSWPAEWPDATANRPNGLQETGARHRLDQDVCIYETQCKHAMDAMSRKEGIYRKLHVRSNVRLNILNPTDCNKNN